MTDDISSSLDYVAASEYFRELWESKPRSEQRQIITGLVTMAMFDGESPETMFLIRFFQFLSDSFRVLANEIVDEIWEAHNAAIRLDEDFRQRCLSDPVIKAHIFQRLGGKNDSGK